MGELDDSLGKKGMMTNMEITDWNRPAGIMYQVYQVYQVFDGGDCVLCRLACMANGPLLGIRVGAGVLKDVVALILVHE